MAPHCIGSVHRNMDSLSAAVIMGQRIVREMFAGAVVAFLVRIDDNERLEVFKLGKESFLDGLDGGPFPLDGRANLARIHAFLVLHVAAIQFQPVPPLEKPNVVASAGSQ